MLLILKEVPSDEAVEGDEGVIYMSVLDVGMKRSPYQRAPGNYCNDH